eukprot:2758187-Pyramimonas_sp.AAC.1
MICPGFSSCVVFRRSWGLARVLRDRKQQNADRSEFCSQCEQMLWRRMGALHAIFLALANRR